MSTNYLTLNLPIHHLCRKNKLDTLDRIIDRDVKVIKYMFSQLKSFKTNGKYSLDKIFLSTKTRKRVLFNLKKLFELYSREYQELRDNVYELYKSYKKLGELPFQNGKTYQTSRRMRHERILSNGKSSTGTCQLIEDPTNSLTKLWLKLYNVFSSKSIYLPIQINSYLTKFMNKYQVDIKSVKTIHISKGSKGHTIHLTFDVDYKQIPTISKYAQVTTNKGKSQSIVNLQRTIPSPLSKKHNIAVLGLDPGIRVPYTGCWLIPDFKLKGNRIRYYSIPIYQRKIDIIDKMISQRQTKLNDMNNNYSNQPHYYPRLSNLTHSLEKLRLKRKLIRREGEVDLTKLIAQEVQLWENKGWKVKIAVGYPHSVNKFSAKQFVKSRTLRRRTSRWNYKSRPEIMQRVFASLGMVDRVIPIGEEYTSRTCWKCGITEFRKFRKQITQRKYGKIFRHGGWFECLNVKCGWKGNADLNGCINIGKKLFLTLLFPPSKKIRQNMGKCQSWWIEQKRTMRNQLRNANNNKHRKKIKKLKYSKKKISWKVLIKQKYSNLNWFNYPTSHLSIKFQWIKSQPPKPVPIFAEVFDKSVLCPIYLS